MSASGHKMIFTVRVKNLRNHSCFKLLWHMLSGEGFSVHGVHPGMVQLTGTPSDEDHIRLMKLLSEFGFEPVSNREILLVEEIKQAVHELIYEMNNVDSVVRKSEYLVEKLNRSYSSLSRVFSLHSTVTLEKYIILHKTGRIRELIDEGELSLSEIAFMMDYNSVQYLSYQFKSVTGCTVSEYKQKPDLIKPFLDELSLVE